MASSVRFSDAQEHLGELLDRVERGEEIVIERDGRAVSKLVPVAPAETPAGKRVFGQICLELPILPRTSMSR